MRVVSGKRGINSMTIFVPDLMAELTPSKCAAGFKVGECFDTVEELIGVVEWYDKDSTLDQRISSNIGWMGVVSKCGFPGGPYTIVKSLVYMNNVVSLEFEENLKLYRVCVGRGYGGSFAGVRPGDRLRSLEASFDIIFNDMDDDFLLEAGGKILEGVSFITDYRASLEHAPEQTIQFISIHDWSLR